MASNNYENVQTLKVKSSVKTYKSELIRHKTRERDETKNINKAIFFSDFMELLIERFKANMKIRTSETYRATLVSLRRFYEKSDITFNDICSDKMEDFQAYLQSRSLVPNTISFYMRILRATYNRAVEAGLNLKGEPFRHVYTGIDKTIKRALSINDIGKIKSFNLSQYPEIAFARDIFMLSFYLRGMSFVDMAFLKKTDLKSGYLIYRRRKTGQLLTIKWRKEMEEIVNRYNNSKSYYLLPIIKKAGEDERGQYLKQSYTINRSLKKLTSMLNLHMSLTLYVARHSWASIAKRKGIPIGVISEGMGHDSETTTRIYLDSLENSAVDEANSIIIMSV